MESIFVPISPLSVAAYNYFLRKNRSSIECHVNRGLPSGIAIHQDTYKGACESGLYPESFDKRGSRRIHGLPYSEHACCRVRRQLHHTLIADAGIVARDRDRDKEWVKCKTWPPSTQRMRLVCEAQDHAASCRIRHKDIMISKHSKHWFAHVQRRRNMAGRRLDVLLSRSRRQQLDSGELQTIGGRIVCHRNVGSAESDHQVLSNRDVLCNARARVSVLGRCKQH